VKLREGSRLAKVPSLGGRTGNIEEKKTKGKPKDISGGDGDDMGA
jgi:hypothetical protein